jgi:hypothetical protein
MADDSTPKAASPTTQTASSGVKVRLLARMWQRPVFDDNGKQTGYKRYRKGDVLTLDQGTVDALNSGLKKSLEEVTD